MSAEISNVCRMVELHGELCCISSVLRVARKEPDFLDLLTAERVHLAIEAIDSLRAAVEATPQYQYILRGAEQFEQMRCGNLASGMKKSL